MTLGFIHTPIGADPVEFRQDNGQTLVRVLGTIGGTGGPGGATTFLGLTDTPGSYADQAGKGLRVNAARNALEFVDLVSTAAFSAVVTTVNNQGDAIDSIANGLGTLTSAVGTLDSAVGEVINDVEGLSGIVGQQGSQIEDLVSDLAAHEGDTEAHGISAYFATVVVAGDAETARGLLGAAAAEHTHPASDIDSGTLDRARLPTVRHAKTVIIPEPVAGDRFGGYTRRALTLTQLSAVLVGSSSPSVGWTLRYAADRSAAGTAVVTAGTTTTTTTTAQAVSSFDNAVIPANHHWWLEIASVSGTVDQIEVTLDAEEAA